VAPLLASALTGGNRESVDQPQKRCPRLSWRQPRKLALNVEIGLRRTRLTISRYRLSLVKELARARGPIERGYQFICCATPRPPLARQLRRPWALALHTWSSPSEWIDADDRHAPRSGSPSAGCGALYLRLERRKPGSPQLRHLVATPYLKRKMLRVQDRDSCTAIALQHWAIRRE
jgi:hypothetical protein